MKLYAQHGFGPGDKIREGMKEGIIDGVIYSARYEKQGNIAKDVEEIKQYAGHADILLDPEIYACFQADLPDAQLGGLTDWPFFAAYRRSHLETTETVNRILEDTLTVLIDLPLTAIIAPNIYIPRSFNSIEAVIAKNFIRRTRSTFAHKGDKRRVFSTLAIGRDALLDQMEFESFLNDITALDDPPDGFYLLIGGGMTEERTDLSQSEVMHADVIANWMLLNYTLSLNGFIVINGCSDILTPFLGGVGGYAGATGWWTNLRMFSMNRYIRSAGGRLPSVRYLSNSILNRITFSEREAIAALVPEINNGLPHDKDYEGKEPQRNIEVLQTWEAIADLNKRLVTADTNENLSRLERSANLAEAAYEKISMLGIQLNVEAKREYITVLSEGIRTFKRNAEI
jgi:hypothetical protein